MEDYPLDEQELTQELELANPFDNVRVAFDYAGFEKSRRNVENFDIPGWRVSDYYVTVDNVGIAALSLLFTRRTRFSAVGDVYTGIFLSIVTYSIAYAQLTPSANVLTKADLLFYLTFVVVLGVFLRFIVRNAIAREEPVEVPRRAGGVGAYLAVTAYVLALLAILLT